MRKLAIASIALLAVIAIQAQEGKSLLRNGDLSETGELAPPVWNAAGWVFSKWNLKEGTPEAAATKWGVVKEQGDEARKCLWTATSAPVKVMAWWQQEVKCEPGETYTLSFRAKGSAGEGNKSGFPGCGFYLLDASGKWLLFQPVKDVELSSEWKSYSASVSVSEDTAKLGVRLGITGENGALEMFFDDVKLVRGAKPAQ